MASVLRVAGKSCAGLVLMLTFFCLLWTAPRASAVEHLDRGLVALPLDGGKVYLGWRLLLSDPEDVAFNVYRSEGRGYRLLTKGPIRQSTNFVDETTALGKTYYYRVAPVVGGKEGPLSRRATVRTAAKGRQYVSIPFRGKYRAQKVAIADLDGDGRLDYVIKQPDFNVDPYQAPGYWKKSEDTYKIEAYRHDGRLLWVYDMGWAIEEGIWYSPIVAFDFDGDGKAEVVTKAGEGDPRGPDFRVTSGPEYCVVLDGETGKLKHRFPWPSREGYESYNYYCRNFLGVAYLDGKSPSLIVQRGTYTLIKTLAYNGRWELIWRWRAEGQYAAYRGQGFHGLHAADLDGDGRDELLIGAAALDDDGSGLWTLRMGHPDVCYVADIDPQRPGLEVFYGFETRQKKNGVCLVDAATGKILWGYDGPTKHVHGQGMIGDIDPAHPGIECYASEKDGSRSWLYSARGELLSSERRGGCTPRCAWWDADEQKELIIGGVISDYGGGEVGRIEGRLIAIADCLGDWREELLCSVDGELRIYTTTIPARTRRVCLMQDRQYRTDVAHEAMGYFFPPQLGGLPLPQ